ncbi:hypothetical protein VTN00DRAFT_8946 [Thermoascus crustaceus]|uniref:uncharacterized protein n=1 Tax=Thermoascus crustaceus TaxID=5088 RepID=UPI0037448F77
MTEATEAGLFEMQEDIFHLAAQAAKRRGARQAEGGRKGRAGEVPGSSRSSVGVCRWATWRRCREVPTPGNGGRPYAFAFIVIDFDFLHDRFTVIPVVLPPNPCQRSWTSYS